MKRATKYTTGTGEHWGREVRGPDGRGLAWCGQPTGERDAKRIAAALNRDARQAAELRRLRAALRLVAKYLPAGYSLGDTVRAALKPARRKP